MIPKGLVHEMILKKSANHRSAWGWSSSPDWHESGLLEPIGLPASFKTYSREVLWKSAIFPGAQKFQDKVSDKVKKNEKERTSAKAKGPGTFLTDLCPGLQVWQAYNPLCCMVIGCRRFWKFWKWSHLWMVRNCAVWTGRLVICGYDTTWIHLEELIRFITTLW